jgi:hypothetical protein
MHRSGRGVELDCPICLDFAHAETGRERLNLSRTHDEALAARRTIQLSQGVHQVPTMRLLKAIHAALESLAPCQPEETCS